MRAAEPGGQVSNEPTRVQADLSATNLLSEDGANALLEQVAGIDEDRHPVRHEPSFPPASSCRANPEG